MTVFLSSARPLATKHRPALRLGSLRLALTVWSERRALAKMDATRLADMGISPDEAATEAARKFWDLPDRHRC